jgi:hypothetical protein
MILEIFRLRFRSQGSLNSAQDDSFWDAERAISAHTLTNRSASEFGLIFAPFRLDPSALRQPFRLGLRCVIRGWARALIKRGTTEKIEDENKKEGRGRIAGRHSVRRDRQSIPPIVRHMRLGILERAVDCLFQGKCLLGRFPWARSPRLRWRQPFRLGLRCVIRNWTRALIKRRTTEKIEDENKKEGRGRIAGRHSMRRDGQSNPASLASCDDYPQNTAFRICQRTSL